MAETLRSIGIIILIIMAISAVLGTIFLAIFANKLRKLDIPPDASFAETLHLTPFMVVVAIDLLDLGLDFLAAPISWIILDRLGLKALRGVAAVEALIPGTQIIPLMTLSWIGVRLFNIYA